MFGRRAKVKVVNAVRLTREEIRVRDHRCRLPVHHPGKRPLEAGSTCRCCSCGRWFVLRQGCLRETGEVLYRVVQGSSLVVWKSYTPDSLEKLMDDSQ